MIRFVYIGGQITEGNNDFAWYNTVTEQFIQFADQVVFDSWEDFEECFALAKDVFPQDMDRYKSLFPEQEYKLGVY